MRSVCTMGNSVSVHHLYGYPFLYYLQKDSRESKSPPFLPCLSSLMLYTWGRVNVWLPSNPFSLMLCWCTPSAVRVTTSLTAFICGIIISVTFNRNKVFRIMVALSRNRFAHNALFSLCRLLTNLCWNRWWKRSVIPIGPILLILSTFHQASLISLKLDSACSWR